MCSAICADGKEKYALPKRPFSGYGLSRDSCFCSRKKGRETAQRVVQLHHNMDVRSREKLRCHWNWSQS